MYQYNHRIVYYAVLSKWNTLYINIIKKWNKYLEIFERTFYIGVILTVQQIVYEFGIYYLLIIYE